jgi:hypothetical protein
MTESVLHPAQITPAHSDDVANDASELAEQKALRFEVDCEIGRGDVCLQ